jgi:hypothetical protein
VNLQWVVSIQNLQGEFAMGRGYTESASLICYTSGIYKIYRVNLVLVVDTENLQDEFLYGLWIYGI